MSICQFSFRNQYPVRNRWNRYFLRRTIRKLKLNAEQQRNLESLQAALTEHGEHHAENLTNTKAAIGELIKAQSFDRAQANRLAESMNLTYAAHTQELVSCFGNFYDQLDGSQREVLRTKWSEHTRCNKYFH